MNKRLFGVTMAAIGLVGGLWIAGHVADAQQNREASPAGARPTAAPRTIEKAAPEQLKVVPRTQADVVASYAPLVKQVAPAVINVYAQRVVKSRMMEDPFYRFFFGDRGGAGRDRVERSLGSGVVVRANGLAVTNNHVIDGADQIIVVLADRREFPAKVIFTDAGSDLAVLRFDPGPRGVPALAIGDSDRVEVGDIVLAIGNPLGLNQTVTSGIVSAVARTGTGINDFDFFIQTDASINPGNSGGPLVSMSGQLIGVNTAIFSRSGTSSGIGFAVPSNMVRAVVTASTTGGRLVRPWLGAEGQPVTADTAASLGLERPVGVLVNALTPGSPMARAGIRPGDVVFAVDGREVADIESLRARVATKGVGGKVILTVIRDRKASNITVDLLAPPETPPRDVTDLGGASLLAGVRVANLSPALSQELGGGLPDRGVVVLALAEGAPAARQGLLRPGDVLLAVNGTAVRSVDELQRLLPARAAAMNFRFARGGATAECGFQPPANLYCRQ